VHFLTTLKLSLYSTRELSFSAISAWAGAVLATPSRAFAVYVALLPISWEEAVASSIAFFISCCFAL